MSARDLRAALVARITHYQGLSRTWRSNAAGMRRRAAEADEPQRAGIYRLADEAEQRHQLYDEVASDLEYLLTVTAPETAEAVQP